MKTIKHISLWAVVATCMVAVSTRGNAQAVSSTYFNVDWQFNAPVGNSYADKASGWGMNFEGGYYVMPKMAIGAFISYHTNNKYIDRQTLMLKSNSALTTDQQHSAPIIVACLLICRLGRFMMTHGVLPCLPKSV